MCKCLCWSWNVNCMLRLLFQRLVALKSFPFGLFLSSPQPIITRSRWQWLVHNDYFQGSQWINRVMPDNSFLSFRASIVIVPSHLLGVICHYYILLFVGPISRSLFLINPLGNRQSSKKLKHIRFGYFSKKSQETKAKLILASRYMHS